MQTIFRSNQQVDDGDEEGDHFDAVMAKLLKDTDYGSAFAEDLERTDALGTSVADRVSMYNPLYYLKDFAYA